MTRNGFELYLVRHAIAAERGPDWPDDRTRPLTRQGITRFKEVVRGVANFGVVLDVVYTSPLARARQTAELLSEGLPKRPEIRVLKALAPGGTVGAVLAGIRGPLRRVALVGHEPDLGGLAAFLIGTPNPITFKKGGIARIDLTSRPEGSGGSLIWFVPPKLFRR